MLEQGVQKLFCSPVAFLVLTVFRLIELLFFISSETGERFIFRQSSDFFLE